MGLLIFLEIGRKLWFDHVITSLNVESPAVRGEVGLSFFFGETWAGFSPRSDFVQPLVMRLFRFTLYISNHQEEECYEYDSRV